MASRQTKSFISLIILAVLLSVGLLFLAKVRGEPRTVSQTNENKTAALQTSINTLAAANPALSDMKSWKKYSDSSSNLTFKYPSAWQISTADTENPQYHVIILDPGQGQDHIRIYSNSKGYFASDGLAKKDVTVAGQKAWTVEDLLIGVKSNSEYFTFDLGSNLKLKPTFKALISTVAFNE